MSHFINYFTTCFTNYSTVFTCLPRVLRRAGESFNTTGWVRATALALLLTMAGVLAGGSAVASAQPEASAVQPATVNINTADADTLAKQLKGVGSARANEIVRYRETYGQFTSADELLEVKGIGRSTLDMNRQRIVLE